MDNNNYNSTVPEQNSVTNETDQSNTDTQNNQSPEEKNSLYTSATSEMPA